ncbi:biotin transporter BioY [Lichenibacterium ramalinae]|uniref:Biotin transporter n=1 Tax=Lichenibacterium ramalinae TaxID=2316527 RepID=A0A4Q2RGX7_9HYPH|nr:biotin transporter BioY [Lichenibacterium ramalinae]RYB05094.1 biotin transporter BioY [Lichenibacterium ramalinae]
MSDIRFPAHPTLAGAVWPEAASTRLRFGRAALLALLGSAVMALSAKLSVPFYPVPLTLESLAVILIGAAFGARLAGAALVLYLVEGALGLPVFAGTPAHGLGLAYMAGPTGGYLLGFVLAAVVVGFFAERGADRSVPRLLGAMALGHAILFATGYAWLARLIGPEAAWTAGVLPFLLGTAVKTLLGALLVPSVWNLVGKRR